MLTLLAIYAGCLSLPEIANSGAKVVENLFTCKRLTDFCGREFEDEFIDKVNFRSGVKIGNAFSIS